MTLLLEKFRCEMDHTHLQCQNVSENLLYKIISTFSSDSFPWVPSTFKRPCNYNGPIQI